MCGIYGIISRKGDIRSDSNLILAKQLANFLEHRGPDGQQMILCGSHVLLGHTRLAINDVDGGKQPFMHSTLEGIRSIVNGEIYNYYDIKRRYFSDSLYELDTSSDCEILPYFLHGLLPKGDLAPMGMYAAASYSYKDRKILLARDFFGEKPLYYYMSNDVLIFCSEIRALAAVITKLDQAHLNQFALAQFLLYGYSLSSESIYREIRKVEAGSIIELSIDRWHLSKREISWTASSLSKQSTDHSYDAIKDSIISYIKDSTLSDVPLCMGLSGGLDSTFIAAITRDRITRAYTVNYEAQGGSDEAADAISTAKHLNIPHTTITISNRSVARLFVDQIKRKDSPIVDIAGIGYAALYERMHADGFKVALMGHGGDELYMGYPWLFKSFEHNKKRASGSSFIYEELPDFRTYFHLLSKILKPDVLDSYKWLAYRPELSLLNNHYGVTFDLARRYWLEPNSLSMGDSLSMSYSIESRHPLLSKQVYNMLQGSNIDPLFYESKGLLKKVMREFLPDQLIQREKRYFSPPFMHYYSMIDSSLRIEWNNSPVLRNLGILKDDVLNRFYKEGFKGDAFDYYLFPRLATLQVWLQHHWKL